MKRIRAGKTAQLASTYCEDMRSRVQSLEFMESQICGCESATMALRRRGQGAEGTPGDCLKRQASK